MAYGKPSAPHPTLRVVVLRSAERYRVLRLRFALFLFLENLKIARRCRFILPLYR
jgi:hypothetical protein